MIWGAGTGLARWSCPLGRVTELRTTYANHIRGYVLASSSELGLFALPRIMSVKEGHEMSPALHRGLGDLNHEVDKNNYEIEFNHFQG